MVQPVSVPAKDKAGITHTPLLKSVLPGTEDEEVIVWDTEYAPGVVNPRHVHPAAITFRILSGTGIWQEEGKPPVTLHAGDSLSFRREQSTRIGTQAPAILSASWNSSWQRKTKGGRSLALRHAERG